MIERIVENDILIAIIIRDDYTNDGITFFTPDDFSQQLAYMSHKKGKIIDPHVHNKVVREVHFTQEVLIVKKGKIKVDLYDSDRKFLVEKVLGGGDIILLANGGHGFEVLEDAEFLEVKQGPYTGDKDKTRF